ncbi:MAG: hypothetical protein IJA44_01635 [Clostridia bacterium]|nr:hypothetical protein [Clostridia bacterium]
MLKKLKAILSLVLCLICVFLTACTEKSKDKAPVGNAYTAQSQVVVKLPQTSRLEKILDSNGKISVQYLDTVYASSIVKNYDNRVYIKYNGKPYFYNPVYISYEQIINSRAIAENRKTAVLEESFAKAKECGFTTVALYIDWKNFYNGETYNFDFYKIYYKLAEKYDLNVSIIWNGYAKNGFMPWQIDREKYPVLTVKNKSNVPDLSQEIYINEAVDAITQFCAWLNYIDYGHRTILIQLEDEANANYGKGTWLSQFANFSDLLLKMADAVKASPYNVVTTVGLNFEDYRTTIEGVTGRERLDKFLNYKNIDGLGAANLATTDFNVGNFANHDKFCYVSKLSPAIYNFFSSALELLSQGYQFGVYELKSFDLKVNCGMYRTHSTKWDFRNRQTLDSGILAKKRTLEAATPDVVDFIKGINNLGEILATANILDIIILNPLTLNNYDTTLLFGNINLGFSNISNPYFTYNSALIAVIDPYSNYYFLTFHLTSLLTVYTDYKIMLSEGKVNNEIWNSEVQEIILEENNFVMKSGLVYRLRFEN